MLRCIRDGIYFSCVIRFCGSNKGFFRKKDKLAHGRLSRSSAREHGPHDHVCDNRGSFTEIIRTTDRGQFSVNVSNPGITKGNHWHHTKNEKFVVVKGEALIQLRRVGKQADGSAYPVEEFQVSGEKIQVVEMIPGYTHNIINLSDTEDLVTFMWANEPFDSAKPDTFFEKV